MGLNIKKGRQKTPRRTLVYGTPGVGKSTFAAGAVNPLFIPVEDGSMTLTLIGSTKLLT